MSHFIDPTIQEKISNFVSSQFPQFYLEEGQNFIQFMKAYYEWMESDETGGVIKTARKLLDYRDIDNTLDSYLTHFQNKYLYGIPLYIQGDKRYLIKHILDIYNSKGTIEGYKLLFKLLYNEDIEIYVPKNDILRASDGRWVKRKYLEVTDSNKTAELEGVLVSGAFSKATAVAESYVQTNINGRISRVLYISNITGTFILNEPIVPYTLIDQLSTINLKSYPTIVGSVGSITIIDGGQDFNSGDVLITSSALGTAAKFNVTNSGPKRGITFSLREPPISSNFTANAVKILTRTGVQPFEGNSAAFTYSIILNEPHTYSKEIIAGYENVLLNASTYGLSGNVSANISFAIANSIPYVTAQFGRISNVVTSNVGVGYVSNPTVTLRDVIDSTFLSGNISFSNTGTEVVGDGTNFTSYFTGNSIIKIVNSYTGVATDTEYDYRIVTSVANATHMTLDDYPNIPSNTAALYKLSSPLWTAQFPPSESYDTVGNIRGQNEYIQAIAGIGTGTILSASVVASGLSYSDSEVISIVKANAVTNVLIKSGGAGYANGENLVFAGGGTSSIAVGTVNTFSNGTISLINLTNQGSGYQSIPVVKVQTTSGTGAILSAVVGAGTSNVVTGQVGKVAVGFEEGTWIDTRGFLNSDKYIQDSYYYQDYSYSIKSGIDFTKYVDVLKKVFHIAGTEIFGNPYIVREETSTVSEGEIQITQ